jgi:hypothetical protein
MAILYSIRYIEKVFTTISMNLWSFWQNFLAIILLWNSQNSLFNLSRWNQKTATRKLELAMRPFWKVMNSSSNFTIFMATNTSRKRKNSLKAYSECYSRFDLIDLYHTQSSGYYLNINLIILLKPLQNHRFY